MDGGRLGRMQREDTVTEWAVYRRLAKRLDRIPNGFAATSSGVELELLACLFTPEEAALASVMRLTRESPETIADRAGVEAERAAAALQAMRGKGLIRGGRDRCGPTFGLMPFIVGIYEEQLERMDANMAELFERYMIETGGGSNADGASSVHRVIPVEQSIPIDLEIFPYERASEILDRAKSWAVRDCICRVQQRLVGKGCEHTVENCLVFSPRPGAFDGGGANRPLSREEAQDVLTRAAEEGLVHSTMNQRDQIFYICSCCTCCCGVMRGVAEFGVPTAVARSDFRVAVDGELCTGCGACVRRCPFGALAKDGNVASCDGSRCVGCGVCVSACEFGALALGRRPAGEVGEPPANLNEWMTLRARERGVELQDVL